MGFWFFPLSNILWTFFDILDIINAFSRQIPSICEGTVPTRYVYPKISCYTDTEEYGNKKSFLYKNFSYFISTSRPLAFFNEKVYPPTKGIPHESWVSKLLDLPFKVTIPSSLVFKEYHPNLVQLKKAGNLLRKKSTLNIVLKWVRI